MTAWHRRLPLALIACSVLVIVATYATEALSTGQPSTRQPSTSSAPASQSGPIPRIAIVYDVGGRGSGGFNELAWEGAKRAADMFDAELKEVTAESDDTDADREERLTELAAALYHPIIAISSTYAGPIAKVAAKYPQTWFGIVDVGTVDAPNVAGIRFNDEQGSFLVGAAAALTSTTGKVGFVGAVQSPPILRYEAGFTAGALAADPGVEVQVTYLSPPPEGAGSSDPADAREAALGMYDAGADVIFGAGGDAGDGVIQAAHDRGLWAIGVNSDQYVAAEPSVRGSILTSMVQRADVATYTVTMEVAYDVAKAGNNVFGLDRGGVGYSTSGGFVDPIRGRLDAFAAQIAAGEILVPTKP